MEEYKRYFPKAQIQPFKEKLTDNSCLRALQEHAILAPSVPHAECQVDKLIDSAYVPFKVITYIRSTANDILISRDNEEFYGEEAYISESEALPVQDEILLSASNYMRAVLPEEINDPQFVMNTLPSVRGYMFSTEKVEGKDEPNAVYAIVAVLIAKEVFDNLDLSASKYEAVSVTDLDKIFELDDKDKEILSTYQKVKRGENNA